MVRDAFTSLLIVVILLCSARAALAVPVLQLYVEAPDTVYDPATETWVTESTDFKLWVIGDVEKFGPISDMKLAAAVLTDELNIGSIALTSTTTDLLDPFCVPSSCPDGDPSTPDAPVLTIDPNVTPNDGEQPVRGDGTLLPSHDIYGPGVSFFEWYIQDLTLLDSPVGDFIDTFPDTFPDTGQVNVYQVSVSGFSWVHFDTYDHILEGDRHGQYKFAPFSHDGESVPEPKGVLLLGFGLLGLGLWHRLRKSGTPG